MIIPNINKAALVTPVIPINAPVVIRIEAPKPEPKAQKKFTFNVEKFIQFLKDELVPEVVDIEHAEL